MSFSDLVSGGAECGPANPLATFSKRFGQDRGAQLDRFGEGAEASGSSSRPAASFRTQQASKPSSSAQAFFQHQQPHPGAFDLAPLKGALPFSPPIGPLEAGAPYLAGMERSWQGVPVQQRDHFEATFRHTPPPAVVAENGGWAREYSPGAASPANLQAQPHHHHRTLQQHSNYGQGSIQYRSHLGMQGMGGRDMMGTGMGLGMAPNAVNAAHVQQQPHQAFHQQSSSQVDSTQWDTAFTAYERPASPAQTVQQQGQQHADTTPHEADELARTAGRLVSTVEHETNSKFKQSNFLNLMRKIRDKQAGIQGTDIVETSEQTTSASPTTVLDKGKGRAQGNWSNEFRERMGRDPTSQQEAVEWASKNGLLHSHSTSASREQQMAPGPDSYASELEGRALLNDMWAEEDARSEAIERQAMQRAFVGDGGNAEQARKEDEAEFAKYQRLMGSDFGSASQAKATAGMEEDFDQSTSPEDFVGRRWEGTQGRGVAGRQGAEWDALQKDWDAWQASPAGMRANVEAPASAASAPQYRFHAMNPYVGTSQPSMSSAEQAASLPADMQSVLEREAAVQRDPTNATAWLDLGVKQQENEREALAIAALHRAIQLDPTLRDAWLALAVSYTNENDRMAAFEAIERWIEATPEYSAVAKQHQTGLEQGSRASQGYSERHERLSNLLIALARHGSLRNEIDADVQVALGVLFNASEDYDKAVDCFAAALSVRPEDWLLYNRLGATLSNSGRSEEALRYYHQALDLRPGFVRCHFNLSISCLNLKLYQDAASHIYTALTLQSESADVGVDTQEADRSGGITSNSLWETLRVSCELMNRPDLANLAMSRDLSRLDPSDFWLGDADDQMAQVVDP